MPRGGLDKGAAPYLSKCHPLHCGHLPLGLQVHFVAHQQDRHPLAPFHPHNLISHSLYVLESLVVGEAIDDDETLPVLDVEVAHGGELLGAGSVQDLQHTGRGVHLDLLQMKKNYS